MSNTRRVFPTVIAAAVVACRSSEPAEVEGTGSTSVQDTTTAAATGTGASSGTPGEDTKAADTTSTAPDGTTDPATGTADGGSTETGTREACPDDSVVITEGDLQSAVDGTPTGGTLCLDGGSYTLEAAVTVDRAMRVLGVGGPSITQTHPGIGLFVVGDDVAIEGLTLAGPGRGTSNDGCGSGPQGIVVEAVSGLEVRDNSLSDYQCGIFLSGTSAFEITGNVVVNTRYVGIGGSSIHGSPDAYSLIDGNTVLDVCWDCPAGTNAYGIVATSSSASPVSDFITISNNDVRNTSWECYDTHNGYNVDFLGNYCENPAVVGINVAYPDYDPVSRVEDNIIVLAPGKTNLYNSIVHVGDDYMGSRPPVGGGTVVDNTTMGFGDAGTCGKIFTFTNVVDEGNQCM